eukprot:TRINITY_DN27558_c0_g1_i1.p1 TRINITY_DN27558_c0_g1~~TRINITY_DN27558_c0_g1_i1.p1  ORF type:complete len:592 (-),score=140.46 TRINITY_DN27558_c0_g1_i1:65-1762(-)
MKFALTCLLLLLSQLIIIASAGPLDDLGFLGVRDAPKPKHACLECTLTLYAVLRYAETHEQTVEQALDKICDLISNFELRKACETIVASSADPIIRALEKRGTIMGACHEVGICTDANTKCTVPEPNDGMTLPKANPDVVVPPLPSSEFISRLHNVNGSPWDRIMEIVKKVVEEHKPLFDIDHDLFATTKTLRGSHWRGRDCADVQKDVYPGRKSSDEVDVYDINCNGIYGINKKTGKSYEEEFCGENPPITVTNVGDSVGGHFSMDWHWLSPQLWDHKTFDNFLPLLEDEMNRPSLGWITGFEDSAPDGPIDSLYLHMRKHNRCNHRHYQNLSVNGGKSTNNKDHVNRIASNPEKDQPHLIIFEEMGNDVCNSRGTLDDITKPEDFLNSTLARLEYLDTKLANGSHILFVGILDVPVHYDILHDQIHPLGFHYGDFYEYMNCLSNALCWPWFNKEKSIREAASEKAALLNKMYEKIIAEYKFKNFDMAYYRFPIIDLQKQAVADGYLLKDTLDPVDGFHPSQILNSYMGTWLWDIISTDHPDWIGKENPHNAEINAMFGDQGGY